MSKWQDDKREAFKKMFDMDYVGIERRIDSRMSQWVQDDPFGDDSFGNRYYGTVTGRFKISSPNPQMWTQPNPFPQYSMAAVPIFQGCPCPMCRTASDIDTPLHPATREHMISMALRRQDEQERKAQAQREAFFNDEAALRRERARWID